MSEEVRAVHTELVSASDVAVDVVGAALASSAAAAAARSRVQGDSSSGGDSTVSGEYICRSCRCIVIVVGRSGPSFSIMSRWNTFQQYGAAPPVVVGSFVERRPKIKDIAEHELETPPPPLLCSAPRCSCRGPQAPLVRERMSPRSGRGSSPDLSETFCSRRIVS